MINDELHDVSSPKALYEILKQSTSQTPSEADYQALRYALYARKSTTGDERQERSIPDQIKDCMDKVVAVANLNVVKVIQEKQSAKDPDIRREFKSLLDDVRSGRIDGIISWHPDRLSRNMKEAGEIIDLLDKGILKDLRFATSTFENSPTGKMLLGISFVLSKQYSEHLSESVTRGNRRKIEDGIFFDEMKHGYIINDQGQLHPDGYNFALIQQAFEMRLANKSQKEIAEWLNTTSYTVRKKSKPAISYTWDKDRVSKLLKDPVYAGVLKYGHHFANLEDHYEFTPAITVEDFLKINKVKDFNSPKLVSSMMSNKRENTKANLLRRIVCCGFCNKPFSSGLTGKQRKDGKIYYYNYKCENKDCTFYGKSVRAKHILYAAYEFLDTHIFTTQSNYDAFIVSAKKQMEERSRLLTSDLMSLTKSIALKKKDYEAAKGLILSNPELGDFYDLREMKGELEDLEKKYENIVSEKAGLKDALPTYKKYLELFGGLSVELQKTDDMALLDQILRKFFSNFTVKQYGVGKQQRWEIDYKLNEPYEGFVNSNDFDCGRGERTQTFDLSVPNRARYQLRHTPIGVVPE